MHNFLFFFETKYTGCLAIIEFRDKLDIALIFTESKGKMDCSVINLLQSLHSSNYSPIKDIVSVVNI